MSGYPRWASDAPSFRCTIAWTIDCGCTTTSIRSYGTPNRWCASISSRPLFISVAESIVIFPPMSHVGCASASSRVTASRSAAPAERPAAGREHQPVDGARALAPDQLEERGVLRVHRQELGAGGLRERRHELAAHDQALLVGEREVDALAERRHRRAEPGRADQRVKHEVAVGVRDQLHEPLRPGEHLHLRVLARARGRVRVGERHPGDAVSGRLLQQQLPARRRGESHDLELGAALDDVQRLRADGAGRADYEDPAHPPESRVRRIRVRRRRSTPPGR